MEQERIHMPIFIPRPANPKLGDTHTQPTNGTVWEYRKFKGKAGKTYTGWQVLKQGRPLTDDEFRQASAELWTRLGVSPDKVHDAASKVRAGRARKLAPRKV